MTRPALVEHCAGCGGDAGKRRADGTLPYRTADRKPLCSSCWGVRRARGLDGDYRDIHEPGALPRLMRGVDVDGKVPEGSEPWQFRPYRLVGAGENCECSQSGKAHICRPPPPTHIKGGGVGAVRGSGFGAGLPPPASAEELALATLTNAEQVAYLAHRDYGGKEVAPGETHTATTIAALIGVEPGAYRVALSRARAKMRAALGAAGGTTP